MIEWWIEGIMKWTNIKIMEWCNDWVIELCNDGMSKWKKYGKIERPTSWMMEW